MSMKQAIVATSIGVVAAGAPLAAHVSDVITPDRLWSSWTFDPLVIFSLGMAIWLYRRGVARVWARAGRRRGVSAANAVSFAGGITALVVALVSPLDSLGGTLLSAHMAQHGL